MWINKTIISKYISQAALTAFSVSQAILNLELAVWVICWFLKRRTKFKGEKNQVTHENKNATLVSWSKLSREVRKFPAQNSAYKGIPEGWGQGLAGCHSNGSLWGNLWGACLCGAAEAGGESACWAIMREHCFQSRHTLSHRSLFSTLQGGAVTPVTQLMNGAYLRLVTRLAQVTQSASRRAGIYFNTLLILE